MSEEAQEGVLSWKDNVSSDGELVGVMIVVDEFENNGRKKSTKTHTQREKEDWGMWRQGRRQGRVLFRQYHSSVDLCC